MKIRLRIPLKLPYKNELTPSYGNRAFFCFKAMQREWSAAIPEPRPDQRALGPRRLTVIRVMTGRERRFDTANIYYGSAAILDILVRRGWLVDDTDDVLDLARPVQRLGEREDGIEAPATLLEIEDLPGAAVRSADLPLRSIDTEAEKGLPLRREP